MNFNHWLPGIIAACCLAVTASALADPLPVAEVPATPVPATVADTQSQIDALRKSELSQQSQISRAIHAGSASSADIIAAAASIQDTQVKRNALEKQLRDQLAQNKAATATTANAGRAVSAPGQSTVLATGTSPLPLPSDKGLPPEQQVVVTARRDLVQKLAALKDQAPDDGTALVQVLKKWEQANAKALANSEQARAASATAHRARILADLLAAKSKSQAPIASVSADAPKMQAVLNERAAAARDLQLAILQTANMAPDQISAALAQWQAAHGQLLDRLTADAEAETTALGLAGVAKAHRAEAAAAGTVNKP
jgi:hypothetical protein